MGQNDHRHIFTDIREKKEGYKFKFRKHSLKLNLRPHLIRRHPNFIWISLIIMFVSAAVIFKFSSHAEVLDLFPATCLGDWQNPQFAQGHPETFEASSTFSSENSAINGSSSVGVYCGGFVPAEFKQEGEIKSVALTLVWKVGDDQPEAVIDSRSETSSTDATSTESSTTVSWFHIIQLAMAQEVPLDGDTASAPVIEQSPQETQLVPGEPSISEPPLISSGTGAPNASDTTSTQLIATPPVIDDSFLELSYSFNGSDWLPIARINQSNWHSFTMSLPVSKWDDLKNIQIKINSIPTTLKDVPRVMLDGMFIEVNYDSKDANKIARRPNSLSISKANVLKGEFFNVSGLVPESMVEIYSVSDPNGNGPANVYGIDPGSQPSIQVDSGTFVPGQYIVVSTLDKAHCSNFDLTQCRDRDDYVDEIGFSVLDPDAQLEPATSTEILNSQTTSTNSEPGL